MTFRALLAGSATLLTSACATTHFISRAVTTPAPEMVVPASCGFHPTEPEPVDDVAAPALPPRPPESAPAAQQVPYLTARVQRAELGALHQQGLANAEHDARARNAVPQEECATWYDETVVPRLSH